MSLTKHFMHPAGLGGRFAGWIMATRGSNVARNRWVVFPEHAESLPAVRYANLTAAQCLASLSERHIAVEQAPKRQTIDAPVTLPRELRGVRFEFAPRPEQRDVVDCRLVLALDDLARIAAAQQIAVVRYNSIYRNGWARGRVQGHLGGVAIDVPDIVTYAEPIPVESTDDPGAETNVVEEPKLE